MAQLQPITEFIENQKVTANIYPAAQAVNLQLALLKLLGNQDLRQINFIQAISSLDWDKAQQIINVALSYCTVDDAVVTLDDFKGNLPFLYAVVGLSLKANYADFFVASRLTSLFQKVIGTKTESEQ